MRQLFKANIVEVEELLHRVSAQARTSLLQKLGEWRHWTRGICIRFLTKIGRKRRRMTKNDRKSRRGLVAGQSGWPEGAPVAGQ